MNYLSRKYSNLIALFKSAMEDVQIEDTGTAVFITFHKWGGRNQLMITELKHESEFKKTFFRKPKIVDVLVTKWEYFTDSTSVVYEHTEFMYNYSQSEYFYLLQYAFEAELDKKRVSKTELAGVLATSIKEKTVKDLKGLREIDESIFDSIVHSRVVTNSEDYRINLLKEKAKLRLSTEEINEIVNYASLSAMEELAGFKL